MRILIADDDALSRRMLEATLQRLGHDVLSVEDGSAALDVLLGDDGPAMAILDWVMPGADGLAICEAVRERSAKDVYLILLTAKDQREDMVAGLDAGADDFMAKPCHASELQMRVRLGVRILELQERLRRAEEALRAEAARDHLTGLWNRRTILDHLHRELRRAAHENRPFSIVLADLDRFDVVNGTHGHAAGDDVLRETARRIRSAMRDFDLIGRYGGEEFLMLLPGCDAGPAGEVAERVRAGISAKSVRLGDVELVVSVSLGVACATGGGVGPSLLIQAAEDALSRAKSLGRNRVEVGAPTAS